MRFIPILLAVLLLASTVKAEECAQGSTCVPPDDMKVFVGLMKEKKCLQETKPEFKLDPITVITDDKGRVFYTGHDPKHPYKLKMTWCSYEADGTGDVQVVAAVKEPETWGFRFRPKAYLGYLPMEPLTYSTTAEKGIDAGLMLDFFHWQLVNVNVAVGFRSFGLGLGVDIIQNFGAYLGYAMSWVGYHNDINSALWFAF